MTRLANVKCFLLDMDGTFYLGDKLIEGSLEFIERVRNTGRDFLFLTNNSSHNAKFYVNRLKNMGLDVSRRHILTSGEATARVLNRDYAGKRVYLLGNSYLAEEFSEAGVALNDADPEIVVIGYDTTLTYSKLTRVCDLVRAGLPYIATHPDFNCPTENGFAPDIGAVIEFINASAFRRPDLVVGKPNTGIVDAALARTNLAVGELCMVGDRLYTDIETGRRSGMLSILVMSGETTPDMLAASPIKPDLVFDRLFDIAAHI